MEVSSKPWLITGGFFVVSNLAEAGGLKGVEFNHRHWDFNKKNMHVLRDFTSLD